MPDSAASQILGYPVPVLGVTGEMFTGKTLFLSSLCPEETLMIDAEESSKTYNIPFKERISLFDVLAAQGKQDWQPIDAFKWFHQFMLALEPGKFRVAAVDPLSDMEIGLPDYVSSRYADYGFSSAKSFEAMGGVYWGKVNDFWKQFLGKIASKVEIFAFSTHMTDQYKGKDRTGQRKAKGKRVVAELASLYIQLQQNINPSTGKPVSAIPKGTVLKSRLGHTKFEDGELKIIPILPPVLQECTPAAIRKYVQQPPDWKKLKRGEYEAPKEQTEEEKLEIQREIADAHARAEEAKLEQQQLNLSAAERVSQQREEAAKKQQIEQATRDVQSAPQVPQPVQQSAPPLPVSPAAKPLNDVEIGATEATDSGIPSNGSPDNPFAAEQDKDSQITPEQVAHLESQFNALQINGEQLKVILSRTNSENISDLPFWRAFEISSKLTDRLMQQGLQSGK